MARQAVQAVVEQARAGGVVYLNDAVVPDFVSTEDGRS